MLVTHGDKCLLGRQSSFQRNVVALRVVEAAETIQDAVRREISRSRIRCTDVNCA
jgi:NADH pyrophosphatase NudC (nudix superfamily)